MLEEQLEEQLEKQLSLISHSVNRRRIKREINILIESKICNKKDIIIKKVNPNYIGKDNIYGAEIMLCFTNLKDNKYYEFAVHDYYPFKPPKLLINNKILTYSHSVRSSEFTESLKKTTGFECFCCQSILCADNWSPKHIIKDIIEEIENFKHANMHILYRIMVNVIKRKYLNKDINIMQWLY